MKKLFYLSLVILLVLTYGMAFAASGNRIKCGGTVWENVAEVSTVTYTISNFANKNTARIKKILVYDQSGAILCDLSGQLLDPSGHIDIPPHESFSVNTSDLQNCTPSAFEPGPIILQTEFSWDNVKIGDLIANQVGIVHNNTTGVNSFIPFPCYPEPVK